MNPDSPHTQKKPPIPALLLHGFGGDAKEWQSLLPLLIQSHKLPPRQLLTPTLPGHGPAPTSTQPLLTPTLAHCAYWLKQWLDQSGITRVHLFGYSLGGRIALTFAQHYPEYLASLTLEGAHPGLQTQAERQQRQQQDAQWAARFAQQPLAQVWAAWYQQPLFAELSTEQRQALVAERADANGPQLAAILSGCSLATQTDLRPIMAALPCPLHYLFGSDDSRFAQIATALAEAVPKLRWQAIDGAGHNAHRAQPAQVAATLNLLWSLADD